MDESNQEHERHDHQTEYPDTKCLHELFEQAAHRAPDRIAVEFEEKKLTYRELNEHAERLAYYLRSTGLGAGQVVGLYVERSVDLAVGLLGIMKAGCAYLPIDPATPADRVQYMLGDSGARVVVTLSSLRAKLGDLSVERVYVDSELPEFVRREGPRPTHVSQPDDLAYVIYTSGSTGRPKGVLCCHRGVVNLLWDVRRRLDVPEGLRCSAWASVGFDVSVYEIFGAFVSGGTLVFVPEEERIDPDRFVAWLCSRAIEHAFMPPHAVAALVGCALHTPDQIRLSAMLVGVEPIRERVLVELRSRLPHLRIVNGYGPTEAAICATLYDVPNTLEHDRRTPIGRPVANTGAHILDEALQPVADGVVGEIYLSGVGVARGYIGRPDLTAKSFLPDGITGRRGGKLYRTGDLARRLPDGNIEFVGRADRQVKLRGYRIELGEIEAVLSEYPGVGTAVVEVRGATSEVRKLVGYIVHAGSPPKVEELREFLSNKLPAHMIPAVFVFLTELPLNQNGKVDREALPEPSEPLPPPSSALPRDELEAQIAGVLAEVLKVKVVGRDDDFVASGGHSLLAAMAASRLRERLGIDISVRDMLDHSSVARLAEQLRLGAPARIWTLTGPTAGGLTRGPASMAQDRRLRYENSDPNRPRNVRNVSVGARIKGQLDVHALELAICLLVERHDVLRTHFQSENNRFSFVVSDSDATALQLVDLREVFASDRDEALRQRVFQDCAVPFDLMAPPSFRAWLYVLGEEEHALLITTHHISFDGWSTGVLANELSVSYAAFARGAQPDLPKLRIQHADFAIWQNEELTSDRFAVLDAYWRKQLEGEIPVLDFPVDRPRPVRRSYAGTSVEVAITPALTAAIRRLCARENVTLYVAAMTAYQVLLALRAGRYDVAVFSNVAGRDRPELENMLGCFTNTVLIRTDLGGDPSFREALARVRRVVLSAFEHWAMPYQRVLAIVRPPLEPRNAISYPGLNLESFRPDKPVVDGLRFSRLEKPSAGGATNNMYFEVVESGERLRIMALANSDLYEKETVEQLVREYLELLRAACDEPSRPLTSLHTELIHVNKDKIGVAR